jgi:hypothetical protein
MNIYITRKGFRNDCLRHIFIIKIVKSGDICQDDLKKIAGFLKKAGLRPVFKPKTF